MANLTRFKDLEKPQASRLGDKATFDHKMNCLTCFRWSTCQDPMKSYRYRCTRYNEAVDGPQSIEDLFASSNPLVKKSNMMDVDPSEDPAIEQRLEAIIEAAINSNSPIPPDIKLNDHEIPIADNFYQWLMDDRFTGGGMTPFPRQVYVGATLFNDLCVAEGTRIQTNKGLVRIEEICGDYGQNKVEGWKALSRKGFQGITHGGKTSKRKVKCLTISSSGRDITVTPDHRVLVNREGWKLEWVKAKDIRIGDNLCAPHEEGKFGRYYPALAPYKAFERDRKLNRDGMLKWPKKVTPQICRLIGYLLGDGTLGKYGISFTNRYKKITDDFVECMKHITDLEPRYYVNASKSKKGAAVYVASYNSIEIAEWFQHVGVPHSRYENKSIPDWIYRCPKEGIISFLTGILESDGSISNRSVRLTMTAKDVVIGTSLLMQNLGIYGTTKVGVHREGFRPTFYWGCHNYDGMVLFKKLFGNLISRLAGPPIKPRSQTNVRSQTRPTVLRNCGYVTSLCRERLDYHTPKYINLPSRTESCEFSDVESLIGQLKRDNYLKEHTDGALEIKKRGYALLSVTNIKDAGYHNVYDITVPNSESFTANGLMVHNCPRCSDMEWLEHKMKVDTSLSRLEEKLTFLVRGKCPTCNGRKRKFIAQGLVEDYKTLVLIVGQRGTKTSSLLLCETYNLHRYLKSPSPTKLFGVQPTQLIMSTYTATTFQQVRENVWEPYMNIVTGSPWFANYNKFLVKRGQELGEELAVISEIFVRYRHRNLLVAPAGPSKRTMRGRTRFSAFIDEISWLPMNKVNGKESERGNAKETYTALRNSLRTLFSAYDRLLEDGYDDVPKPLMLTASSPATINDWGMKLYRDSKIERSILGLKFPTWEFNPNLKRKDFDAEFRTNPVESARDFGCMPPIGNSTWMTDIETVTKAFADKRRNAYSVETYKRRSKTGKKRTHATVTLKTEKRPVFGCLLTLDVGVINNSLAFAISTVPDDFDLEEYIERMSVDEDGNSTRTEELDADAPTSVPVKVLFVGEIIPYHECTISLTGFYKEVLMQICNDFEIVGVASDRWQHLNLVQNLESDFGIEYFERRLTWDDFVSLKEAFFDKEISLPRLDTDMEKILSTTLDNYPEMFRQKPMDHLAYQILTVQEAKGNTVIKGDATDDMFRCVALAHSMLQDVDFLNSLIIDHEAEHIEKSALGMKVTLGASSNSSNLVGGVSRHVPKGHESAIAVVRRGR